MWMRLKRIGRGVGDILQDASRSCHLSAEKEVPNSSQARNLRAAPHPHRAGCLPVFPSTPTSLAWTARRPWWTPSWRTMVITCPLAQSKHSQHTHCLECQLQAASQHSQHTHLAQVTWPRKRQSTSVSTHAAPLSSEDGLLDRYTLAGSSRSCSLRCSVVGAGSAGAFWPLVLGTAFCLWFSCPRTHRTSSGVSLGSCDSLVACL